MEADSQEPPAMCDSLSSWSTATHESHPPAQLAHTGPP